MSQSMSPDKQRGHQRGIPEIRTVLKEMFIRAVYGSGIFRVKKLRKYIKRGVISFKDFDDTRSIFVHIPKTAGKSVKKSLYGRVAGDNWTIAHYQSIFSKRDFDSYFKFTFVRNPWDRLFCLYKYMKSGGGGRRWAIRNLFRYDYDSFEKFVVKGLTKKQYRTRILFVPHFAPQIGKLFLVGTSRIGVDFLGFFENLDEDFKHVSRKIYSRVVPFAYVPLTYKTERQDYLENYSKGMIDIVGEMYRTDVETLGYSFDNSSLGRQITIRNEGRFCSMV